MSGLVESINTEIFSDFIYVITVKLCLMVLLIELYLLIPLPVTQILF